MKMHLRQISWHKRWLSVGVVIGSMVMGGMVGAGVSQREASPTTRDFFIKARQYAYEPSKLHVNTGDTLRIRLASLDVVHGFFVEGHDIDAEIHPQQKSFFLRHPSSGKGWKEVEELTFVVGSPGKYRFRCSHTCGTMHPFMQGEMIVAPNIPLHAGIGSLLGLFLGMMITSFTAGRSAHQGEDDGARG
jgi:plastocyanin